MFSLNKNSLSNYLSVFLTFFLYLSLLLGFILGENSTGGAFADYYNQKQITSMFSKNFFDTLLNYDDLTTRHSPVLIIILSQLEQILFNDHIVRLFYLHFCLLLPYTFFKILELKFRDSKEHKKALIFLSLIIFLSPTFRSLAIWPDSRIIGLTFFAVSIFFFQKFLNTKKNKYIYKNILFYSVAAYFSPNFAVFSIFFVYKYFKSFGLSKKILKIVFLNLILAIPAFYYIFYLDVNFLNKSGAINDDLVENLFFNNIFNQIFIIPTIFLFYFLPFYFLKILVPFENYYKKTFIISLAIFFSGVYFFDYSLTYTGGGIFFKISHFIFDNNFLFYFFVLISLIVIINFSIDNIDNFLIFILLILSNPQITIYHKYYDPLLIVLFFSIFSLKINKENLLINKNLFFLYFYFLIFLFINILKKSL
tara:strand:- start:2584 stop:3849 length:1266 start_codon:yes stop_codon:yes gene_type:complete